MVSLILLVLSFLVLWEAHRIRRKAKEFMAIAMENHELSKENYRLSEMNRKEADRISAEAGRMINELYF